MKGKDFTILMMSFVIIILTISTCNQMIGNTKTMQEKNSLEFKLAEQGLVRDSLNNVIKVKDIQSTNDQASIQELRNKVFQTEDKYNKSIRKVNALIAQSTTVIVDEVQVPYLDTPRMKNWEDSVLANCNDVIKYYEDSSVLIGTLAKDSTKYYTVEATVSKSGILINKLSLVDSQYISITEFKGGFLKRNTAGKLKLYEPRRVKLEIKHTNPYFINTGSDGYLFKEKPQRGKFIRGVVTGSVLTLLLLSLNL